MTTTPMYPLAGGSPRRVPAPLGDLDRRRLISTREVARLAGVSVSSIRRWRDEDAGFPPPRVLGDRTLRWTLGEVVDWIESRPRADTAAWEDGMDLAEREEAARRARGRAASLRLDQTLASGLVPRR